MKTKITILLALFICVTQFAQSQDFITEWTFPSSRTHLSFKVLTVGTVNYSWTASPSGNSGSGNFHGNGPIGLSNLNFAAGDVVTFTMEPTNLRRFYIDNGSDRLLLTNVLQWGAVPWTSMEGAFYGCENMQITATDVPNLSGVGSMRWMFRDCLTLNGPTNINSWNTSSINTMFGMFLRASEFNQDIGNWNVSNVTNMSRMFWLAASFNMNIEDWNVSNVINMSEMFKQATLFNQNIGTWDVSNVTNMSGMFWLATSFNQNIGYWNVGNVSNMSDMFLSSNNFNQDIGGWDVSNVTNMSGMLSFTNAFNHFVGNWDVSNVTNMSYMFFGNYFYDRDIGNWDVSSVTNMESMFQSSSSFNQDISNWNVSAVTNMRSMFKIALNFNHDISTWNVANVSNMGEMFSGARDFNQSLQNWNVSNVTTMSFMFNNAVAFNQNLGAWSLRSNVSMLNMLNNSGMDCNNYSATLVGWEANNQTVTNRTLGASGRVYGLSAVAARNGLINNQGWTISGDSASDANCDAALSIDSLSLLNYVEVYPNPSALTFTLKFKSSLPKVEISIFNSMGQLILNQLFENRDLIIMDLKERSGIFLLQVNSGNQSYTQKLIKI